MVHQTASEQEIYQWLTNDFESAWECLANSDDNRLGRGNFAFALQSTVLLEWASRLCKEDPEALNDFANELNKLRPRYFTRLPGEVGAPKNFTLPHLGYPRAQLLTLIFDLIRNGQAHRYLQIAADFRDGGFFYITLGGAHHGHSLLKLPDASTKHLDFMAVDPAIGFLFFEPGVFYWEIKSAIESAALLSRGLSLDPSDFARSLPFTLSELKASLQ